MDNLKNKQKKSRISDPRPAPVLKGNMIRPERQFHICVTETHAHSHNHRQVTYTGKCRFVLAHVETEQVQYAYEIPFKFNQLNI